MIPNQSRDLSQQQGNPTSALQAAYRDLMAIQDPQELMEKAINTIKPLVGRGMSELNYKKFMQNIQGAAQKGVQEIQKFLSNYVLAGSGLSTGAGRRGSRGMGEDVVSAIASFITEDRNDVVQLNKYQRDLKLMVETYGRFNVVVVEDDDMSVAIQPDDDMDVAIDNDWLDSQEEEIVPLTKAPNANQPMNSNRPMNSRQQRMR